MDKPVSIWIEAEEWAPGEWDIHKGNTDAIVTLDDGTKWVATFFSYQNILRLAEKNQRTGECMAGKYFWASDMILVDEISRERIEEVVHHLLAEKPDEFRCIFDQSPPDEEEEGARAEARGAEVEIGNGSFTQH